MTRLLPASLILDVASYHFDGSAARGQQAEAAAPEILLPQFLPNLRKLLLEQTTRRALVSVDELAQLTLRLGAEQYMHVVHVVVPFLHGYPILGCDVLEYLTRTRRNDIVEHGISRRARDDNATGTPNDDSTPIPLSPPRLQHVRLNIIITCERTPIHLPPTLRLETGESLAKSVELFGNNVAYEIRLQQALEEDMLCPSHYYGVGEYISKFMGQQVSADSMTDKDRTEFSRWLEQLTDPNRVRYIIDKIQIYSEAGTDVRGLVFCSRRDEAKRLSAMFNEQVNQQVERPYRTKAITGENSQAERDEAVKQLKMANLTISSPLIYSMKVWIFLISTKLLCFVKRSRALFSHSSSAEVYVRQAVKIRL